MTASRLHDAWDGQVDLITIAIVPRERFSPTAAVIESVKRYTSVDYELILLDTDLPPGCRREVERALQDVPNARVIPTGEYLLPSAGKVLVAEAAHSRLTCLLENDCLVTQGWLPPLLAAMEQTGAEVAAPMVQEADHDHGAGNLGDFQFHAGGAGTALTIQRLPVAATRPDSAPRIVHVAEAHCLLFETETLRRVRPFDPELNTREFLDMSLQLRESGVRMVFQPQSRVQFLPPPPVEPEDRPFFFYKWDRRQCDVSHRALAERWRLTDFPDAIEFVRTRNHSLSDSQLRRYIFFRRIRRRLRRTIAPGASILRHLRPNAAGSKAW